MRKFLFVLSTIFCVMSPLNAKDKYGNTPLHEAAREDHVNVVQTLIAGGATIDAKNQYGYTPLHYAASNGHVNVVQTLIANKADVNAKDSSDGYTPLHYAASNGHVNVVQTLIANKADVNAKDSSDGYTPLHEAAVEGQVDVVQTLIVGGADVNAKNQYGYTPLHEAAVKGQVGVVKTLIAGGADKNIKNNSGKTALDLARSEGKSDVVALLDTGAESGEAQENGSVCTNKDLWPTQNREQIESAVYITGGLTKCAATACKEGYCLARSINCKYGRCGQSDGWCKKGEKANNSQFCQDDEAKITECSTKVANNTCGAKQSDDEKSEQEDKGLAPEENMEENTTNVSQKIQQTNKQQCNAKGTDFKWVGESDNDSMAKCIDLKKLKETKEKLNNNFKKSRWKNAEGNFNTARLASDSIAGVALGTVGGIVTNKVVKKNQVKKGFEDIGCYVNGQLVADWGDEFPVGAQ